MTLTYVVNDNPADAASNMSREKMNNEKRRIFSGTVFPYEVASPIALVTGDDVIRLKNGRDLFMLYRQLGMGDVGTGGQTTVRWAENDMSLGIVSLPGVLLGGADEEHNFNRDFLEADGIFSVDLTNVNDGERGSVCHTFMPGGVIWKQEVGFPIRILGFGMWFSGRGGPVAADTILTLKNVTDNVVIKTLTKSWDGNGDFEQVDDTLSSDVDATDELTVNLDEVGFGQGILHWRILYAPFLED